MDFTFTPEQSDLRKQVIDFVARELTPETGQLNKEDEFPSEYWQSCARFGIQGFASIKGFGGKQDNIDFLTSVLAMESFGYACRDNGLAFGLNAQMWTVQLPILQFGSESQKSLQLAKMASGEWIGAHALTEEKSGSDAFSISTTAKKVDDGYLLNGEKCMVSLAPVADIALVFASTDPSKGKWGISAFLVHLTSHGVTVGQPLEKMGLRTIPMGNITFSDCLVPQDCLLGEEGAGFAISNHSLEYERCSILASQLGAMERQLEVAIDYVSKRKQFGKPVGKFQSVSNRIADMKLRLETSRLLLYKSAWLKSAGKSALMESSLLKLHLSESFVDSSLDAIRSHGGYGYLSHLEVERDLRDAVGGLIYAGTSDIQRNIIARLLGL